MVLFAAVLAVAACGREPLEWVCPDVGYGGLVLTEIRGPQTGSDDADWFEIYNASGRELDLYGTQFFIRRLNGDNPRTIIVRDPGVIVGAGEYAVLGRAFPGEEPAHIDYGYADDFPVSLYDTAAIDILGCGELVDRVEYRGLPRNGSLGFDGALEPSADLNALAEADTAESHWCLDIELQADTGQIGTPGERNRACADD
jgi:hypothetical protein